MKLQVYKVKDYLVPAFNSDYEIFKKMPLDEPFYIEYKKSRNPAHHRMFFALMKLAFENQELFDDMDTMRKCLLIECGYVDELINSITGQVFITAKSISFGSMDQVEFNEIYTNVRNYIAKWLGVSNEDLEDNINQYF